MPPPGGLRTPLTDKVTAATLPPNADQTRVATQPGNSPYTISTSDMTRFKAVFQPEGGLFAPGYPLAPTDPRAVRRFDYPVGVDTIFTPRTYELIGFAQLRALAENHDITRLAIETRKDQVEKLTWTIKPRDAKKKGDDARIPLLTAFFEKPDGEQSFATWLRTSLEDVLVLDAAAFEVRKNRGGQIIGLDVVDGSTMKVLIDETGRRPPPPAPAYLQVIHGRPWRLLTRDELLYAPRNPRPHKMYGFGPVEQIIMTVNIALRRQMMQLQWFTDGNVPAGLINAPEGWSPDQVAQYQEWFDSLLAGNTALRQRLVWGPAGSKYQAFKDAPIKDEFDEWLARVVCYAFSLPPTAFVRQMNRATAESAQQAALEEGLQPLMGWVKRLCDHIIQVRMGHADLEFSWSDVKPIDPTEQVKILDTYVKNGSMLLDEARDQLGLDPYPNKLGQTPLIIVGSGVTRLEDAIQPPPPPPVAAPPGSNAGENVLAGNGKPGEAKPGAQQEAPKSPTAKPQPEAKPAPKEAEQEPIGKATSTEVDAAAALTNTSPSQAQIAAGNYRKGHIWIQGLDVTIENPRGSERKGEGPEGPWSVTMPAHYGYVCRTTGADGEQVDVYIGPDPESTTVFVVDQVSAETGQFDEHKAMVGYDSLDAALADYHAAFSDNKDRAGAVHRMTMAGFKTWLRDGNLDAPLGQGVGKAAGVPFWRTRY